jgi:hypothetical protein
VRELGGVDSVGEVVANTVRVASSETLAVWGEVGAGEDERVGRGVPDRASTHPAGERIVRVNEAIDNGDVRRWLIISPVEDAATHSYDCTRRSAARLKFLLSMKIESSTAARQT